MGLALDVQVRRTIDLTHAGPKSVDREAELRRPFGVVCRDLVTPLSHHKILFGTETKSPSFNIGSFFAPYGNVSAWNAMRVKWLPSMRSIHTK